MKSKSYWQKRFEQLENARHSQSEELIKDLEKDIKLAQKELEKEINNWYARIAVNNDISIREAKKLLKANELEEFKWTVEEYIKKGKQNEINEQWIKELENASAKFHISRLEQIKLQTRQIIEQLYDDRLDKIDTHIERMYTDGYYKSLYELQKGIGLAFNVTAIDTRKLSMIMSKPWAADGRNFSDRIWTSKAQLINEVHTNLTRMCMLGEAPDKAINNIAKAMNVSKNQASRLVMTEAAYFGTESQREAYKELDVEEYEILATLDYKTSDICRTMDGKHFKLSDMQIGVNAPPFHCYCRTVTIPYFDDEFTKNEKRWSRKNNGETELVDGNLTYEEWEKKYVKVGEQEKMLVSEKSLRTKTNNSLGVNWKEVKTKEYTAKFDKISDNPKANALAAQRSRNCLTNRSGKDTEEIYAINLTKGTDIASITNQNYKFAVRKTEKFIESIRRAEEMGDKVLLIHNHPRGLPPSITDINELLSHNNTSGITVGHDGSVYYYTRPSRKITIFDVRVAYRKAKRYNNNIPDVKGLEILSEMFDFEFRKL